MTEGGSLMSVEFGEQLGRLLREIETFARDYDAGNKDSARKLAESLRSIFHHTAETTSLLAHLRARFIRLFSSVDKSPYPQEWYSPLALKVERFQFRAIDTTARGQSQPLVEPPSFRPMLERKKLTRQVQAPDWWDHEPVIMQQGKKVTRKGVVLSVSGSGGAEINSLELFAATVRQIAYEALKSPDLLKLAR
jgi:hypothetical protein